jgi:hypothetical protein
LTDLVDAFSAIVGKDRPLADGDLTLASTVLRLADTFLSLVDSEPEPEDPNLHTLIRLVRGLRRIAFNTLAAAAPDQAWFWTLEWQRKEREADEAIAEGRAVGFDSDEAFLSALREARPEVAALRAD